ncbi:MAG: 6-carboxytetrahydropterin synthase QueD [Actinobacteria bacterium]|nr:6-carboxytetrahydropterin synthase QueD [Actinomycetota bacterium]
MEVFKTFSIEAAHYLPTLPAGHKCRRLHGHSFRVEIHIAGPVDAASGWVMDFAGIKRAFAPLYQQLDHRCLNDIQGLENPTSENLARWIWNRLQPELPQLSRIVVRETASAGCVYDGPEDS